MSDYQISLPSLAEIALGQVLDHEMVRLHGLGDRWLAAALLRLTRQARVECPGLSNPFLMVYASDLVWHIIPELARRMGAVNLVANESGLVIYRNMQGQEWRECVGRAVEFADLIYYSREPDSNRTQPLAVDVLANRFSNGNPVAMAVDRECPPPPRTQDCEDFIARRVRDASRTRGHEETAIWSPRLQDLALRSNSVVSMMNSNKL